MKFGHMPGPITKAMGDWEADAIEACRNDPAVAAAGLCYVCMTPLPVCLCADRCARCGMPFGPCQCPGRFTSAFNRKTGERIYPEPDAATVVKIARNTAKAREIANRGKCDPRFSKARGGSGRDGNEGIRYAEWCEQPSPERDRLLGFLIEHPATGFKGRAGTMAATKPSTTDAVFHFIDARTQDSLPSPILSSSPSAPKEEVSMMKVACWTVFFIGAIGVPVGLYLFLITHNPVALFDTAWAAALAVGAVAVGGLKLVDHPGERR